MAAKLSNHANYFQLMAAVKRGLTGYLTYMSACSTWTVHSEYLLYEPILRILEAKNCKVKCEVPCGPSRAGDRGDRKRVDFVAERDGRKFAIEVKWKTNNGRLNIENDHSKLAWLKSNTEDLECFVCVFGRSDKIKDFELYFGEPKAQEGKGKKFYYSEVGSLLVADFGATNYGCRIFRLC